MTEARESPSHDPIGRAFAEFGAPGVDRSATESLAVGRAIGPYQLVRVLGEGGMGTVYLAEQSTPVRRTVALKVLRASATSRAAVRRFEAERQALALLDHPSIASIHDAGVTDAEQPYFVMDHVDGPPITRYCDEHRLGLRARVALLRDVCLAVQHAHQRGVIHRDLKPSNVLVTERDGKPLPKVIDFGIAKFELEHDGGPEQSLLTLTGQVIGTPEYMSPEQAAGGARTIDTRTDVYSLGVILYELLTGTLPLELARGRGASLEEALRVIREVDPPRPSQRLRTTLVEPTTDDAAPGDTPALARLVRGDLDWIALMALEKDPERRYASPLELARDLDRFLEHRTVLASPPSARYRASKFLRRNRAKVVAASLLLLSLVVGLIGTTTYLVRSLASERRAIAEKQRAEGQRLAAEARVIAESHPTRALLLALEANELTPGRAANDALYAALTHIRERHVLYGHDSTLTVAEFDRAHERVLTAAQADRCVNLWDARSGQLIHRFEGDGAATPLAAFAKDDTWVVTGTLDGSWTVWDASSGHDVGRASIDVEVTAELVQYERYRPRRLGKVTCLCMDSSGERLALASGDGLVRLVRPLTGELLAELGSPGPPCTVVAIDPRAAFLVAAYADFTFRAWSLTDLSVLAENMEPGRDFWNPPEVLIAPDGSSFAWMSIRAGAWVTTVHSAAGKLLASIPSAYASGYTDGGALLHYQSTDGPTLAWERLDLTTGSRLAPVVLPETYHRIPLDRQRLLGRRTDVYKIIDASGVETDQLIGHTYRAELEERFAPERELLLTGSSDRTARLWDLAPRMQPTRVGPGVFDRLWPLAVSDSGPLVLTWVTTDAGRRAPVVFDVEHNRAVYTLDDPELVFPRLSGTGSHLFAFHAVQLDDPPAEVQRAQYDRIVRVDLATGARIDRPVERFATFGFAPDGRALALGRFDGAGFRIVLHDVESGREVPIEHSFHWTPAVVAWSLAGEAVVLRFEADRSLVADTRTGRVRFTFAGHDADHTAFGFSPDGTRLASASIDRTVIVRDARTGAEVCRYRGVDGDVNDCGFTADGRLAWAMCETTLHLFDAATGTGFARIRPTAAHGTSGGFYGAGASRSEPWLYTVTSDGWFQRWPLDPVAHARAVVPRDFEPDELDELEIGAPEERLDRMERIVRAKPTAARLSRTGSLLAQLGHLERAIVLHEEAVATGTLDANPWFELGRHLARRYARATDPKIRAATAERAIEVLRRAGELGMEVESRTLVEDFDALRALPGFQAMLAQAN